MRISKTFKAAVLVVFSLVTLTATVGLVSQNQDLRRKAAERPILVCDEEVWEPEVCRCGAWEDATCEKGVPMRLCSDGKSYCCETIGEKWECWEVD